MSWTERAACRRGATDLPAAAWFDGVGDTPAERSASRAAARRTCARCPVRQRCLDQSISNDEDDGIWGGLDARQRRRLLAASNPTHERASA